MKGVATACGSATIINAISNGKGAAFGIDLRVKSIVRLEKNKKTISGQIKNSEGNTDLIEVCVQNTLDYFNKEYGGVVKTTSDLPMAVGLSSSSAAANATVLATTSALGEEIKPEKAISIGVESAFETGVTITGAYDDASASFYGGVVVTNNEKMEILKKFNIVDDYKVLIFLPQEKAYTSETNVEKTKIISKLVDYAHDEALSENIFGALTLNGLLYSSVLDYSPKPAIDAIREGAEAAGLTGTGPAIVAICEGEKIDKIKNKWKKKAKKIIITQPSEEGAIIKDEE